MLLECCVITVLQHCSIAALLCSMNPCFIYRSYWGETKDFTNDYVYRKKQQLKNMHVALIFISYSSLIYLLVEKYLILVTTTSCCSIAISNVSAIGAHFAPFFYHNSMIFIIFQCFRIIILQHYNTMMLWHRDAKNVNSAAILLTLQCCNASIS